MRTRSLRHRSPLLWVILPFAGGLISGKLGLGLCLWVFTPLSLGLALGSWLLLARRPVLWAPLFCLSLSLAGNASYVLHRQRLKEREELPPAELSIEVRCERLFGAARIGRVSGLGRIVGARAHVQSLLGQLVYFSVSGVREEVVESERLELRGVLSPVPFRSTSPGFDSYLCDAGVAWKLGRGTLLRRSGQPSGYARFCRAAFVRFRWILGEGLETKQPGYTRVYRAMLLGQLGELDKEQGLRYRLSGTLHLFAISGLHIVAIGLALEIILGLVRVPGLPRFMLVAVLLWLFVDITGASPSAIRSYLMAMALQGAFICRLAFNPVASLSLAVLLVLLFAPLQFFSASFVLSYGIVVVLILVGVPLSERLSEAFNPLVFSPKSQWTFSQRILEWLRLWALSSLALSLASGAYSLLAGIGYFGLLSHGGLAANLVMIPVSVLAVLAGFFSLLCGLVGCTSLSVLFNHAAALVLLCMDRALAWFVGLPWTHASASYPASWLAPLALSTFVLLCLIGYQFRWKPGRFLFPVPLFFAVVLIFLAL